MSCLVQTMIESAGGTTALARRIGGISKQAIDGWRKRSRVPAERLMLVSRITGIPPEQIRPDLFAVSDADHPADEGEAA